MAKEIKRRGTFRAIATPIIALTLAFWIACMGILTWCVASHMLQQLQDQMKRCLSANVHTAQDNSLPGAAEVYQIRELGFPYWLITVDSLFPSVYQQHLKNPVSSDDWIWGKWELQLGYEAAILLRDETNASVFRTGDYLTFTYAPEENWGSSIVEATGMGYIDFDKVAGGSELADKMLSNVPYGDWNTDTVFPIVRMTGYFEGSQFHPTAIDRALCIQSGQVISSISIISQLDGTSSVEWHPLLALPAADGQELETIYAWEIAGHNATEKPIRANGQRFDSLSDLLSQAVEEGYHNSYSSRSLFRSILIDNATFKDDQGPYTVAVAIRCKPLQYAALRLIWVYLISLGAVGLCLLLILRSLKRHVAAPIETMVRYAQYDYPVNPVAKYKELRELEEYICETQQTLSENKAELRQLRTALDYARDAEEKRKQLISNITHELKTPLAIIHSYTESLHEDLSPETRNQYLQTVLEETENMDAMVLQILELSRLEAGRIRLSSDRVSLLSMTESVTQKMKPLFEQRNLTLRFDFVEDFSITADEARMDQVITNLLTNAWKYTVQGGQIRIRIYRTPEAVNYYVENTAPHLSQEALEKVFDSFYRTDEARNSPGTGLGLAIVKTIISLHGGTCSVQNTWMDQTVPGVTFGFVLPLK